MPEQSVHDVLATYLPDTEPPLPSADDVIQRGRTMRRRRATTSAVVAAVGVVAIIGGVMALAPGSARSPSSQPGAGAGGHEDHSAHQQQTGIHSTLAPEQIATRLDVVFRVLVPNGRSLVKKSLAPINNNPAQGWIGSYQFSNAPRSADIGFSILPHTAGPTREELNPCSVPVPGPRFGLCKHQVQPDGSHVVTYEQQIPLGAGGRFAQVAVHYRTNGLAVTVTIGLTSANGQPMPDFVLSFDDLARIATTPELTP